jgi:hypothetical protein
MPTVLLMNGFRFFFYSNENNEPIHIHIAKDNAEGKVWLEPEIKIAYMHNFNNAEQRNIMEIVFEHYEEFKNKWNEYFNK